MVFNGNYSDKRNIKTEYPREIIKKDHVWIPLSDGAKLAATIWLPKDAEDSALPQINYDERPGKWIADTSWPSTQVNEEKFWLDKNGTMAQKPCTAEKVIIPSVQEHGYYAGVCFV
ncbi:hypothetical protein [Virgibacillus halodenitrificans]|uniref:hypothetical protein n=1 Tax=Virgibacillus halodenitrificans TaxID=1482 RepID=UPI0002D9F8DF|nr:hypothetical protein [Virgibacillus halodenitrificans]